MIAANGSSGKFVAVFVSPESDTGNENGNGNIIIKSCQESRTAATGLESNFATPIGSTEGVEFMGKSLTPGGGAATIAGLKAVVTYGPSGVGFQYVGVGISLIPVVMKTDVVLYHR